MMRSQQSARSTRSLRLVDSRRGASFLPSRTTRRALYLTPLRELRFAPIMRRVLRRLIML
jgi:hypothetical protein